MRAKAMEWGLASEAMVLVRRSREECPNLPIEEEPDQGPDDSVGMITFRRFASGVSGMGSIARVSSAPEPPTGLGDDVKMFVKLRERSEQDEIVWPRIKGHKRAIAKVAQV